jgi:D-glycero-alpha-D-manno-heptose-7-phosphate kinase
LASTVEAMHRMKANSAAMKNALLTGDIIGMAGLLSDTWAAKKLTAPGISNQRIDQLCEVAFAHGALAGKISGAGGGGFLVFIVPPENRLELVTALNAAGGEAGPVKISDRGCETWQIRR